MKALVLGGYGGFGARLSRRLADDGWQVLVAGRNLERAQAFASTLDRAEAVQADRNCELAAPLSEAKPDLLVDCAGPFQGSNYRVAEACIAAGVHYLDIADARDFVCGIGKLDEAAKAAGIAVISGASTVPALTGSVLRELAEPLDRVDAVDIALSASSKSTAGRSVALAMLETAGKPVRVRQGGRWAEVFGLHGVQRREFAITGRKPVKGWVALVDTPDLELVPDALPGNPSVLFRGGNDSALQVVGASVLARLVRLGWLKSLRPLQPLVGWLQRLLAPLGGDRSAMDITVKGWRGDDAIQRRWTIIAERGDGPDIPLLAAHLAARRLQIGDLKPGACNASLMFDLADFGSLFDELEVATEITEQTVIPVYRLVMGEAFDRLPAPVRNMHAIIGDGGAEGEGTVQRGASLLARFAACFGGFPPAGTYPVHVHFAEKSGVESWTRSFGAHRFTSHLRPVHGGIEERFGPLRFRFALPADEQGLRMELLGWSVFHIPLPRFLALRIDASERAEGEDFLFDVDVRLPWGSPVVHYTGRLRRL